MGQAFHFPVHCRQPLRGNEVKTNKYSAHIGKSTHQDYEERKDRSEKNIKKIRRSTLKAYNYECM